MFKILTADNNISHEVALQVLFIYFCNLGQRWYWFVLKDPWYKLDVLSIREQEALAEDLREQMKELKLREEEVGEIIYALVSQTSLVGIKFVQHLQ